MRNDGEKIMVGCSNCKKGFRHRTLVKRIKGFFQEHKLERLALEHSIWNNYKKFVPLYHRLSILERFRKILQKPPTKPAIEEDTFRQKEDKKKHKEK